MSTELFYGNTIKDWLISLAIIVGAFILNRLIIIINKNIIQKVTAKTSSRLDDLLFRMLEAPVLFGIILGAIWFAAIRLHLEEPIVNIINKAYRILIVVNITWFISRLSNALINEFWIPKTESSDSHFDTHMITLIRKVITTVIWLLGIVMALHNVGVNISALLGTLGIGGLAFALAAQDTLKNIFGGITILMDRPFRLGDRIIVNDIDGTVEDIGLRSVRIRTLERKLVTIPNSQLSDASIENVSAEPMRRVLAKLGLTYDTTPDKMNEAMSILKGMPKKIKEIDSNDCFVFFSDFGDFSLQITFIYFIKKEADIIQTISIVNSEVLRAFNEAGLNFAFPTQTIQIESQLPNE